MVSVDFPYFAVVGKGTADLEAREVLMNSMNFFAFSWYVNVKAVRLVCYGKGIHAGALIIWQRVEF